MATVLEECTNQQRRSVVRFLWAKGLTAKDIHKCFLFTVGSVCRVKRFTTRWQTELLGLFWILSIVFYVEDKRPQRFGDWICLRPQVDGAG
jgi:hypothetical protein